MATKQPTSTSTLNTKKWNIIYPIYINSTKSLSQGRRVPKLDAVENPTSVGLFEAIKTFGLPCEFEPYKTHPKDFGNCGRIKVKIFNDDDDKPLNPEIKSKEDLLRKIGKAVPTKAGSQGGGDQGKKGKKGKK